MTETSEETRLLELDQDLQRSRMHLNTTLIVLGFLLLYIMVDKLYIDPRSLDQQRKILRQEEAEERQLWIAKDDARLSKLGDEVEREEALKELTLKVAGLEQSLARVKRERDKAVQKAAEEHSAAEKERGLARNFQKQRDDAITETQRVKARLEDIKKAGDDIVLKLRAAEEQRGILFDSIAKQLVKLRNDAPKQVPEAHKERINRIIRRLRDAEKLESGNK